MEKITFEESERCLTATWGDKQRDFAYPPVQGTHQECFQALKKDKEIVPAEGAELALIVNGAYIKKTKRWLDVKDMAFVRGYIRVPARVSYQPAKIDGKENDLAGVFVERDLEGKGLSTKMSIPADVSSWKKRGKIYVSQDNSQIWVPADSYKLGKINEKDGLLIAHLGEEGAELFVKTAKDAKRTPYSLGINVNSITEPLQRVSVLVGDLGGRLYLFADDDGSYRSGLAFGVRKTGKASAQNLGYNLTRIAKANSEVIPKILNQIKLAGIAEKITGPLTRGLIAKLKER